MNQRPKLTPQAQHPRPRIPPLLLSRRHGSHNDLWVLQSRQGYKGAKVRTIGLNPFRNLL